MSLPDFFTEPHVLSGLESAEPILLGLSGGADSSALLSLLCAYREKHGCEIFAAHLNHNIRTETYNNEAIRDEQFCRDICAKYNVKLFVGSLDIPSLAKAAGKSLETEARNARYDFFSKIMRENGIKILATAHNADDNLETQISNLARGCGIDGMIGIPEVRSFDTSGEAIIIRPILRAQKSEIVAYCTENGIRYVTDSTNFEDGCTRNSIRLNIVPYLESLFPSVRAAASRLAQSASEDSDYIMSDAKAFLQCYDGKLPVSKLRELHPSLKKRVIMLAFEQSAMARLENIHISDIISLIDSHKNGSSVSLPKKMRARVIDRYLQFEADIPNDPEHARYDQALKFGFNFIYNTPFAVYIGSEEHICIPQGYGLYSSAEVNVHDPDFLHAKNRFEGAHILDGGVNKKIKKLMCDKKIPLYDRQALPIIMERDEVIYLPKCAISDGAKIKNSGNCFSITVFKENDGGKNEK